MALIGALLVAAGATVALYAFVGYPLLLSVALLLARPERSEGPTAGEEGDGEDLPDLTITVPVFNEENQIRDTLESLLALDYPSERRQILVVSDASTDRTDQIAAEYEARGVEVLRLEERKGKTAAENAAGRWIRGELVLNTDASIRIHSSAPRRLVARFRDPEVGVASGRDVSVAPDARRDANVGERGYVDYEMRIRDLETRLGGIVGASGCLYVIRRELHLEPLPEGLSRDFAAALVAREHGYRSVSVRDAVCVVPRAGSLHSEFRRKVRTVTRGMGTLLLKRHLLNPFRHGAFAWKLLSHKVARWMTPWAGAGALAGLLLLGGELAVARLGSAAAALILVLGAVGWWWPAHRPPPRFVSAPAYAVASAVAILVATVRTLKGQLDPVWEPTRREYGPRSEAGGVEP